MYFKKTLLFQRINSYFYLMIEEYKMKIFRKKFSSWCIVSINMKVLAVIFLCIISSLAHPLLKEVAKTCVASECKIESNCRCSSTINPISNKDNPAPQLIAITVSESIVKTLYDSYLSPLFFGKTNADGNPIGLSFYVNHEYTDYTLVRDLYLRGYEIAVHSVTKNSSQQYWREATLDDLVEEFGGQKTILQNFANIPGADIVGARTPQLQLQGDVSIDAYIQSDLSYDNSWPALTNNRVLPYTLDYASTQRCSVTMSCPKESHPGFWIAPLTNIKGAGNIECNSLATCGIEGTADEISKWLLDQVNIVRNSNRAPLTLRLDSYWFLFTKNSYDGFTKFLQEVTKLNDVFLVSVGDIIEWVKNPVPASQYKTPIHDGRQASCHPVNCELKNPEGNTRYMMSCVQCPTNYPWKGNPLGL